MADMTEKPTYEELEKRIRDLEERKDPAGRGDSSLKENETFYQTILENISDTVIVTDDQGNMVYVCPNSKIIFGLSQNEIIHFQTIQNFMNGTICDLSKLKELNEILNIEWSIENSQGEKRFLLINVKSVCINRGTVLYVMRDITESKQSKENLNENQARLTAAIESMSDAVFISDVEGKFVEFNTAFATFHRFADKDQCYETLSEWQDLLEICFLDGDIAPLDMWAVAIALGGETGKGVEYILKRKDTGEKWIGRYNFAPIFNSDGDITGSVVVGHDITEHKRAEEELSNIFKLSPDMICKANADGYFKKLNPAWEYVLGFTIEELLSKPFLNFIHPEDQNPTVKQVEKQVNGKSTLNFENRYRCKDGSYKFLEWNATHATPDGTLYAVARDITDRKKAEDAILESEEKFKYIFDNSVIGKSLTYLSGEMNTNKAFYKMLGYSKKEFQALKWQDITHPDDIELSRKAIDSLLTGKKESKQFIKRYLHKNGAVVWTEVSTNLRRDKENNPLYFMSSINNITERKQAEEDLHRSEIKYRSMMESITDQLYICSPEFTVEYMNPAMIKRLGRDATGEACHKALHGLNHKCDWCIFDPVASGETIEITIISPLDDRHYRVNNMPIQNKNGTISKMSIFRDITQYVEAVAEKDKAQAQLRHAQKMESIGTLAGGIAHDFNNILYPIIGFTQLSQSELSKDHPVQENLTDILDGAKRARDLVKQILQFSRQEKQTLQPTILKPVVEEVIKLLKTTIPANIDIQGHLYNGEDYVLCDATEIHEIVMNLCTNAYHSVETNGGTIIVRLNKQNPSPDLNLPSGEYICLSVSDNGVGIQKDIIDKIFEPYLTTKEIGKGSGLGLSVVHGIVTNYKGTISVESSPGKGSDFNVFLPITTQSRIVEQKLIKDKSQGGTENILFVDDEASIIKLAARILERVGYTITGKTNCIEALELFTQKPDGFDLVITDMAMPIMTGTEFAKKILKIQPDIPIIICSGFSENVDSKIAKSIGIKEYIKKPILLDELTSKIRKVLDQSSKG